MLCKRLIAAEAMVVIRTTMEQESNIELPNFLRKEVYDAAMAEIASPATVCSPAAAMISDWLHT